ncbi:MAG: four helix bundle protein [bacterium]|nr:four helix bundle protein [bacterium]MDA1293086.1 four helix bundle protein [bacterium]
MSFKSFEEIDAWKESRILVQELRKLCTSNSAKYDLGWKDQILRAGLSVMSNIAEGNDSYTNAEFAKFLSYAKRSAAEVRSQLYYGLDAQYFDIAAFTISYDRCIVIGNKLGSLMHYLHSHPSRSTHTKH